MSVATLAPPAASPLDQSHHRELAAAAALAQPIRRAGRVAAFNAWTTAILAGLSAPFAFFSLIGLVAFVALALVAYNEFRGRRRLLDFDPAGASILGRNQLGLLALITAYCLWSIYSGLYGDSSFEAQLRANPELEAALGSLGDVGDLYQQLVVLVYGLVIALSFVFQGANAVYYFSRRRLVEAYVRATPEWVRNVQRAAQAR
jgi:hypothetical protein